MADINKHSYRCHNQNIDNTIVSSLILTWFQFEGNWKTKEKTKF